MSRSRPRRSKEHRHTGRTSRGPRCPTPGKLVFRSREHAEEALSYMGFTYAPKRPVRVYLCGCGSWHLTSQEDNR